MRLKAFRSKHLLVFHLLLSLILFTSAVPSPRSLKSGLADISVPRLLAQRNWRERMLEDKATEGRMDLEHNDYPDPGPNRGHDPNVPGAA